MVDIEEMRDRFDKSPCALHFGMGLEELSPGFAKVKLKLKEEYLNWENMIQGGIRRSLSRPCFRVWPMIL